MVSRYLDRCALPLLAVVLTVPGTPSTSQAGDIFELDMRCEGAIPAFPTQIVVNVYKDSNVPPDAGDLRGSGSATFDGTFLLNAQSDGIVTITGAFVDGDRLIVRYNVQGYKGDGTYESNSTFEVSIGDSSKYLPLHTSCSQTLWIERLYSGQPDGDFYIEAGDGTCFVPAGECPSSSKLHRIDGTFRVPCDAPADFTVNLYKDESELTNSASASFDGTTLSNVNCDGKVCILGASVDGNDLWVDFEAYGQKSDDEYEKNTSFELVVEECGAFKLTNLHTSCSRPILLIHPYELTPSGTLMFTGGCGECLETATVPIERGTWGGIKDRYR